MKPVFFIAMIFFAFALNAQNSLPLQYSDHTDTTKPLIVYISGDGGMNSFTNSLIKSLNKKGYAVLALDAKSYFWQKKEPQEFSSAMSQSVATYLKAKKRNTFIVIGYSFGADVAPFLASRLPSSLHTKCQNLVLLSPSTHTDFEIKILDMLGFGGSKDKNVVSELNKVTTPVTLFFGSDENSFPVNEITIKKQVIVIQGGHHYDNDVEALATQIISKMK